jgi:hypothetical protein
MLNDFGIARRGDDPDLTATGLIAARGTPSYMAPELIVGDKAAIGPPADVFALGATLYCLLTGRPPFQAASVIETLDLVRNRAPAPPRSFVPGLPRDLETITLCCLQKEPARRYGSAAALALDLERWLGGFPIKARPVSMLESARCWCRRRPALALLLGVLAITVLSSLIGLFTLWRQSEAALARAVASDRTASGAVGELVGLLGNSVKVPEVLAARRNDDAVAAVRDLTARLRRDQTFGAANLATILDVTRLLSEDLRRRGKFDQSRALLQDNLQLLAARRTARGGDGLFDEAYARTLVELAVVARDQGHEDEALALYQGAETTLLGMVHDRPPPGVIWGLDAVRRAMALHWRQRGCPADARRLLETNAATFARLAARPSADPTLKVMAALAALELKVDAAAVASLRAALGSFPAGRRLPELLEGRLADWIVGDVSPVAFAPDEADPETRAAAAVHALDARCAALGAPPGVFAAVAWRTGAVAATLTSEQRRAGHLDDARRTAALSSALARMLVRRDPAEVQFHMLRSESCLQESKLAAAAKNFPASETALRQAVAEARIAVRLDPSNLDARLKLASLLDKLIVLIPDQPQAQ